MGNFSNHDRDHGHRLGRGSATIPDQTIEPTITRDLRDRQDHRPSHTWPRPISDEETTREPRRHTRAGHTQPVSDFGDFTEQETTRPSTTRGSTSAMGPSPPSHGHAPRAYARAR